MKKISIAILVCVFIGATSFKTDSHATANSSKASKPFDGDDYRYLQFPSPPATDVQVTAYDARTGLTVQLLMCPDSGVPCDIMVTQQGVSYEIHSERGKNRNPVEVIQIH